MKTIKIKLSFSPETSITERKRKLETWAVAMLKGTIVNIVEEKHFETVSFIIVENTGTLCR